MGFYLYFNVLIFSLFLVLNIFTAQTAALKLSVSHDGISCTSSETSNKDQYCAAVPPYAGPLALTCNSDSPGNQTLEWFKDSSAVHPTARIKIFGSEKLVLNFTSVLVEDHGNYHCQASSKGNTASNSPEKSQIVQLRVLPYVKNAQKDVTVIEENTLNLTCVVLSSEPVTVTWNISTLETNKTLDQSEGRIVLYSVNETKNGVLSIKSANMTKDRGTYVCLAKNDVGMSLTNSTFSVRVKSKYAALWPFIGICAEVIILCSIILIYEKKRDKSELEESDTDQGPETKSSPDHGQDSVRYRK